jgi:hypothetical protein
MGVNREKVQAKQRRLAETNHLGSSRGEEEEEAGRGGEGREREARRGLGSAAKLEPLRSLACLGSLPFFIIALCLSLFRRLAES